MFKSVYLRTIHFFMQREAILILYYMFHFNRVLAKPTISCNDVFSLDLTSSDSLFSFCESVLPGNKARTSSKDFARKRNLSNYL